MYDGTDSIACAVWFHSGDGSAGQPPPAASAAPGWYPGGRFHSCSARSSTWTSSKYPEKPLADAPRPPDRISWLPATETAWSARGFGAGPLSRSSFDHVHVSRSSATTSIEKSRHEPTPPYPPMMKIFFSASPSSSSSNSTRVAVWCERGCGGYPAISIAFHSFASTSKTCVSLNRLPLHSPPNTRIELLSGSSVAVWRHRGEGTSPVTSASSHRKPSEMCRMYVSLKIADRPSCTPHPPKMIAFSRVHVVVWPERGPGRVPLSFGCTHATSPDLTIFAGLRGVRCAMERTAAAAA